MFFSSSSLFIIQSLFLKTLYCFYHFCLFIFRKWNGKKIKFPPAEVSWPEVDPEALPINAFTKTRLSSGLDRKNKMAAIMMWKEIYLMAFWLSTGKKTRGLSAQEVEIFLMFFHYDKSWFIVMHRGNFFCFVVDLAIE